MAKRGRKSKYKAEYCKEIIEFFDKEPYEDKPLEHYDAEGNITWTDFKRVGVKLPTLVQFAKSIDVSYRTVYRWQDENDPAYQPEFRQAYTRAKEMQKDFLIQAGCLGVYNSHFAKFTAINITDMKDVSRKEFTGEGGGAVNIVVWSKDGNTTK